MPEGNHTSASERDQDWTFAGSWPYEAHYFDTREGRLHYIDEGPPDAPTVVFTHGNPTWSFLWRRFIPELTAAGRRVISFDHLGFGRSDGPPDAAAYRIPRHAERTTELLNSLRPQDATLVAHDWGGPIALPFAASTPEVVQRLVLFNTFAPQLPGPMGERSSIRALRTPGLGSFLVRRRNVPIEQFLFSAGLAHPDQLDEQTKKAYRAPHPGPKSRTGMLVFPREIPFREGTPVAHLTARTVAGLREHFANRPALLVWGRQDGLFGGDDVLKRWREVLPLARVVEIEDAGHFVQEDAPTQAVKVVSDFVSHGGTDLAA